MMNLCAGTFPVSFPHSQSLAADLPYVPGQRGPHAAVMDRSSRFRDRVMATGNLMCENQ